MSDIEVATLRELLPILTALVHEIEHLKPEDEITIGDKKVMVADALDILERLTVLNKHLGVVVEKTQGTLVHRLRFMRISWAKIGAVLGITAQGAYKKADAKGWVSDLP